MAEVKKRDLTMVKYENLKVIPGFNLRDDYGDIPLLAMQILEHAVKVPLQGYKEKGTDTYVIKDGHRRYAALTWLKDKGLLPETFYIPFVLEPQKYSDEQRVIDMFIMNDGKPLTPLEQAEGVRRLQNWGYTDKDIATKIGRSAAYVCKLSSLNTAPKKLINLIQKGTVAASLAMDIIVKGEVDKFLQDVESGVYNPKESAESDLFTQNSDNNGRLNRSSVWVEGPKKITKGDVQPVNSWKQFKRFAKDADEKKMDDDKAKFYKFLLRVLNNEVTEDQIKRFFK